MSEARYILIDEAFQQRVLKEFAELKAILISKNLSLPREEQIEHMMDMVDVQNYLHCCRRTILKHRKNGMPSVQKQNGRIYFWKSEIDKYFERSQQVASRSED